MAAFDLTNHFLIAMPTMADPQFVETVSYICVHNEEGAMGIVINRPLDLELGAVFDQMDLISGDQAIAARPVFHGGPVLTDRGFVIHHPAREWNSTITISRDVAISTSRDILEAIAQGNGPSDALVALGYAGWGAGQLEAEIAQNAWLSGPADLEIMFRLEPELRWRRAARIIGVDVNSISRDIGHA
jgi:putative transcriptional regulator